MLFFVSSLAKRAMSSQPAVSSQPPPPTQIGPYRIGKTLGIGSFSKVKCLFCARCLLVSFAFYVLLLFTRCSTISHRKVGFHDRTGEKVAIKILNRKKLQSMDMSSKLQREISILKMFRHPHIIRLSVIVFPVSFVSLTLLLCSAGTR